MNPPCLTLTWQLGQVFSRWRHWERWPGASLVVAYRYWLASILISGTSLIHNITPHQTLPGNSPRPTKTNTAVFGHILSNAV